MRSVIPSAEPSDTSNVAFRAQSGMALGVSLLDSILSSGVAGLGPGGSAFRSNDVVTWIISFMLMYCSLGLDLG